MKRLEIRKRRRVTKRRITDRRVAKASGWFRALAVIAIALFLILMCSGITSYAKAAHAPATVYKYYTEIKVRPGDTLTDIAGRYITSEYKSRTAYIDEVKFINHLKSDKIIAGHNLIIPYYSVIEKH